MSHAWQQVPIVFGATKRLAHNMDGYTLGCPLSAGW